MKLGVNVNSKIEDGSTALHIAVSANCIESVEFLIEKGADVNLKTCKGYYPIHLIAGRSNGIEILAELASKGADINAQDCHGKTPLFEACICDRTEHVEHLMKNEAEANITEFIRLMGPLHVAAKNGNVHIVKALINNSKADINIKDKYHMTPVHYAALANSADILEILLNLQGDVYSVDKVGNLPVHYAALSDGPDGLEYLASKDPTMVNAQNSHGDTPLHVLASNAYQSYTLLIFQVLMKHKVTKNVKNKLGQTPLFLAYRHQNMPLATILITYGEDMKTKTDVTEESLAHLIVTDSLTWRPGEADSAIKSLLDLNEDNHIVDMVDGFVVDPLTLSARVNNAETGKALLKAGIKPRYDLLRVAMRNNSREFAQAMIIDPYANPPSLFPPLIGTAVEDEDIKAVSEWLIRLHKKEGYNKRRNYL